MLLLSLNLGWHLRFGQGETHSFLTPWPCSIVLPIYPRDTDAFVFSVYTNLKTASVVHVNNFRASGVLTQAMEEGMKTKRKTKK
jgi:hypothetical protein